MLKRRELLKVGFGFVGSPSLVLGSKILMVIGHESCGAVKATMEEAQVPGSIGSILEQIKPAIPDYIGQQKDKEAVKKAVEANVKFQV